MITSDELHSLSKSFDLSFFDQQMLKMHTLNYKQLIEQQLLAPLSIRIYESGKMVDYSIEELEKKIGFTYYPTAFFDDPCLLAETISTSIKSKDQSSQHLKASFRICKCQIFQHCFLSKIDDECGYGLFADCDIPKGTIIGEYSGPIVRNRFHFKQNHYLLKYPVNDEVGLSTVINAESGNYMRFANHSDDPNLWGFPLYDSPLIHHLFCLKRDVKKHEQLCFDYGKNYWAIRGKARTLPLFLEECHS